MCMNGVVIGMTAPITHQVRQLILLVLHQVINVWFVVVVLAAMRTTIEWHIAAVATPPLAITTLVSVW